MSGRCVLVTGASRGIGAACARAFAEAGDRVAIHYGSSEQQAREVLAALPGEGHVLVRGDLADAEQVRSFVDDAATGLGGLDVLVNNAAVYVEHRIADVSYEQWQDAWRRTVDVDLVGTANVTFCVARHMIAAGTAGRIVNVSSRGAFRGEPRYPAYGASKAGLNALGQSLARALAPHGIAVSSVAPGYVATDMAAHVLDGPDGQRIRGESPFGRVARPEEVAAAVLYLASPEAEWASGTVLDLNGASHLRT
ncbi:MAG: SDR family NAD(P)-dependent oxidoreductase [Motilibacteraceae bacterium]